METRAYDRQSLTKMNMVGKAEENLKLKDTKLGFRFDSDQGGESVFVKSVFSKVELRWPRPSAQIKLDGAARQ